MKLSFLFWRSQPTCEPPEPQKIVLPEPRRIAPLDEIPREVWLKRFIESYRRNCMQTEMLSDYTKSLEDAYRHLQEKYNDLKKQNALICDYMKHINETGAKEFELKLENRQLKTELNRCNQLIKDAGITGDGLYMDYKTAILGRIPKNGRAPRKLAQLAIDVAKRIQSYTKCSKYFGTFFLLDDFSCGLFVLLKKSSYL